MSIDWTKPVYDKENACEVWALRRPDGSLFVDKTGHVRVIGPADMDYGWWNAGDPTFTNTSPHQNWERVAILGGPEDCPRVKTLYGIRNGKPFAEVVE